LINEAGEIRLTAVGESNYRLPISAEPNRNVSGDMVITDSSILASGNGAGRIVINAGDTTVNNKSKVVADNDGADQLGLNAGITISVNSLQLDQDSIVSSEAIDSSKAGDVNVSVTTDLNILNGGQIASNAFNEGDAGSVNIEAERLTIFTQANDFGDTGIFSESRSDSANAGNITIQAGNLSFDAQERFGSNELGFISSNTIGEGNAGTIKVSVDGSSHIGEDWCWQCRYHRGCG
jgi:hypothetical protein